jgi:hypothetical protein
MEITVLEYPVETDWYEVKRRALVTVGKTPLLPPDEEWKMRILRARHSPIRYLRFSFLLEDLPYWVSVHMCRHVHAQPYVRTQRNDRQSDYDRTKAPQDAPVDMMWSVNGEELITIANKRLCNLASKETKQLVKMICKAVIEVCPEFEDELVPMCVRNGGVCYEMFPCGERNKDG